LEVSFAIPGKPKRPPSVNIRCAALIDARGFQGIQRIAKMCSGGVGTQMQKISKEVDCGRATFEEAIKPSFEFVGLPGGLHVPDLCSGIGPAAPNLMALGWLSTQILRPYLMQLHM